MNESQHNIPQAYQTGPTTPPKSHGGLIAFLLSLVIFICGIVSVLSLLKIPVFQLTESEDPDISSLSQTEEEMILCRLTGQQPDIQGQTLTNLCRNYYQLPGSVYLTHVAEDSVFYRHGLRSGDILLHCNDMPLKDFETFEKLLEETQPPLHITFYRQGKQLKAIIEPEDATWK